MESDNDKADESKVKRKLEEDENVDQVSKKLCHTDIPKSLLVSEVEATSLKSHSQWVENEQFDINKATNNDADHNDAVNYTIDGGSSAQHLSGVSQSTVDQTSKEKTVKMVDGDHIDVNNILRSNAVKISDNNSFVGASDISLNAFSPASKGGIDNSTSMDEKSNTTRNEQQIKTNNISFIKASDNSSIDQSFDSVLPALDDISKGKVDEIVIDNLVKSGCSKSTSDILLNNNVNRAEVDRPTSSDTTGKGVDRSSSVTESISISNESVMTVKNTIEKPLSSLFPHAEVDRSAKVTQSLISEDSLLGTLNETVNNDSHTNVDYEISDTECLNETNDESVLNDYESFNSEETLTSSTKCLNPLNDVANASESQNTEDIPGKEFKETLICEPRNLLKSALGGNMEKAEGEIETNFIPTSNADRLNITGEKSVNEIDEANKQETLLPTLHTQSSVSDTNNGEVEDELLIPTQDTNEYLPEVSNVGDSVTEKNEDDELSSNLIESEAENVLQSKEFTKDKLTFEGTLKNICSPLDESLKEEFDRDLKYKELLEPLEEHSFKAVTKAVEKMNSSSIKNVYKKANSHAVEIDSALCTPLETPVDSRDTSPTSTPFDSEQVSAAPSPLQKDDINTSLAEGLLDESSMDTRDVEERKTKPGRRPGRRGKKIGPIRKRGRGRRAPVVLDEETRMSAANGVSDVPIDEDSQSSTGTSSRRESKKYRMEVINPESTAVFTAEKVVEYVWPLEGGLGEHYFIQEHISQYLGIISFKRKYPDLRRRPIESQEKEYLKDLNLVSEIACDLGLTAVRSEDVFDIMFSDFPSKYEELQKVLRDRKEKILKEKGKVDYQVVDLDKSRMQEYSRKAALNAAKWNASFNRERNEERKFSFDLQTFTIHSPASRHRKVSPAQSKLGYYPVAVLPGQYVDNCRKHSYSELLAMPMNSVLSGPYTPEEVAAFMNSRGAESEDESPSESCGSSSDVKDELDGTTPAPSPAGPSVSDPLSVQKQLRCKVCSGNQQRNKEGKPEPLIVCGTCRSASHPTCIDLALVMVEKIEAYSWQCMECKTCAQCNDPDDEERMIFCDMCDRGYHIYCVGLRRVPNGRWHCKVCAECFTCGTKTPSGMENVKNPEWQHEFKRDKNKELKYMCTLCMSCDKYWKRRQFCTVCLKVYRSIPEDGMVRCTVCPKYVHREKCSTVLDNERYCNNCFKNRNKTSLNHSRIIAAAKKKMAIGNVMWK